MTGRKPAGVVHEIVGGFCRVCGDTAEWLDSRGRDSVVYLLDDSEEGIPS